MKNRILLMLALFLGMSQAALAQEKHDRMKHRTDRLDEKVNLTEEQKVKINELNQAFAEEMKAMRKEDKEEMREEMHAKMKAHREQIKEILTEEQKDKLKAEREQDRASHKAMREEMKTYRKENIKPVMSEKRKEFESVLTDEEKKQIAEARIQIKAVKKDLKSDKQEKPARHRYGDRETRKATRDQIKSIVDTQIRPIVDAHKTELDMIDKDLEPKRKEWKEDMKAIRSKHMKDKAAVAPHDHRRKHEASMRKHHGEDKHDGDTMHGEGEDAWKMRFILKDDLQED